MRLGPDSRHVKFGSSTVSSKKGASRIQIIESDDTGQEFSESRQYLKVDLIRDTTTFISNPKLLDSMSSLEPDVQKKMIRVIKVFSIFFFTVCFVMIAFTLRYSEYVDAKSGYILIFFLLFWYVLSNINLYVK